MRLFFYGTLCDTDVLARVVGREEARALTLAPARARHFRAVYAAGERYPILLPARGAEAPGVLATGVGVRALRRLDVFERRYCRSPIMVEAAGRKVPAWVYLPRRGLRPGFRIFDIATWPAPSKARFLRRISRRD